MISVCVRADENNKQKKKKRSTSDMRWRYKYRVEGARHVSKYLLLTYTLICF